MGRGWGGGGGGHLVHVPREKENEQGVSEALYWDGRCKHDIVAAIVEHGVVSADCVGDEEQGAEECPAEAEEEEAALE